MKTINTNLTADEYIQLFTGPANISIESRNFAQDTPVYVVVAQQIPALTLNGHLITSLTSITLASGDILYGRASAMQAQAIITG